jgi:hypothetical protein
MSTENLGTTLSDVGQNAPLLSAEILLGVQLGTMCPNDVRDVEATGPRGAKLHDLEATLGQ